MPNTVLLLNEAVINRFSYSRLNDISFNDSRAPHQFDNDIRRVTSDNNKMNELITQQRSVNNSYFKSLYKLFNINNYTYNSYLLAFVLSKQEFEYHLVDIASYNSRNFYIYERPIIDTDYLSYIQDLKNLKWAYDNIRNTLATHNLYPSAIPTAPTFETNAYRTDEGQFKEQERTSFSIWQLIGNFLTCCLGICQLLLLLNSKQNDNNRHTLRPVNIHNLNERERHQVRRNPSSLETVELNANGANIRRNHPVSTHGRLNASHLGNNSFFSSERNTGHVEGIRSNIRGERGSLRGNGNVHQSMGGAVLSGIKV